MKNFEEEYGGVLPLAYKKSSRWRIAAIAVFLILTIAGIYFYYPGQVNSFARKGLAIIHKSFDETIGFTGGQENVLEVNLATSTQFSEASDSITDSQDSSSAVFYQSGRANAPIKKKDLKESSSISSSAVNSKSPSHGAVKTSSLPLSNRIVLSGNINDSSSSVALNAGSFPLVPSSSSILKSALPAQCSFSTALSVGELRIILNEIAWAGSVAEPGETTAKAGNREWMEIENVSGATIDLDGWQILDSIGNIKILFGAGDQIAAGAFYLLSRGGDSVEGLLPDKAYSGALPNTGEKLGLFDARCGLSDLLDATAGWPDGDNATKQTLERRLGLGDSHATGIWQTSFSPGGTPRAPNSIGAPHKDPSSTIQQYSVNVTIGGNGSGSVASKPIGILCNQESLSAGSSMCTFSYASGTLLMLAATPEKNSVFEGWTGPCSGLSYCTAVVGGTMYITAEFRSAPDDFDATDTTSVLNGRQNNDAFGSSSNGTISTDSNGQGIASSSSETEVGSSTISISTHVVIAQIQVAGASSTNDFVKLYNPTTVQIDMSSWKLHKKSSTGTDYSLRNFPKGTMLGPGSYFTWANSSAGFSESIHADASSTETLSADNSVGLFDANGSLVDAVAWGIGVGQYFEGSPYPIDPAANQILSRKFSAGAPVDTDDNAMNFTLQ